MQTEAKNAQCWQHVMTNSAGRVCNQPDAEIAVASLCHSLLARFSRPAAISCGIYRPILQAARQTTVDNIDFREVRIASNGNQGKQITP